MRRHRSQIVGSGAFLWVGFCGVVFRLIDAASYMYQLFKKVLHLGDSGMVFQPVFTEYLVQAGEGQPCASGFILPYADAQGQFQGYALIFFHESGAYLGSAEYQYCGGAEEKPCTGSILSKMCIRDSHWIRQIYHETVG